MQEERRGPAAAPCAGCLGTGECWVCLGTGARDTEHGIGLCASCTGTRECSYCGGIVVPRRRAGDRV